MNAQRREYRGFSAHRMRPELPAARGDGRPPGRDGRPAIPNGSRLFNQRVWAVLARSLNLSHREAQLVRGVFDDATDSSIASALGISTHTVHTHFERLHQKLAVPNRAKLILRVVAEFLVLTAAPGSVLPPVCPNGRAHGCALRNGPPGP